MKSEMRRSRTHLAKSAERLLTELAGRKPHDKTQPRAGASAHNDDIATLLAADLLARQSNGAIELTPAGFAHLARNTLARSNTSIDPFRAQHLDLAERTHGYRICEWDVRSPPPAVAQVPLPPPRPAIPELAVNGVQRL